MVISGPGFEGGKVVDEMTSLIDLPATVLKSGGVEPPEWMQGNHLNGLVDGSTKGWPEEAFMQISESQCGPAIRTARWTYSVRDPEASNMALGSEMYREDFLYDNAADPHQKNNLVSDPAYAEVRADLKARLLKRMADANEPAASIEECGASE